MIAVRYSSAAARPLVWRYIIPHYRMSGPLSNPLAPLLLSLRNAERLGGTLCRLLRQGCGQSIHTARSMVRRHQTATSRRCEHVSNRVSERQEPTLRHGVPHAWGVCCRSPNGKRLRWTFQGGKECLILFAERGSSTGWVGQNEDKKTW